MGCERARCDAGASPRARARRKASWALRVLSREGQSPRVRACARARARGDGDERATRPDASHRTAWWVVGRSVETSDLQDVGRFVTSGTADDFELDSFAFVERPEPGALDGAEVNVDFGTLLVLGCDEPVTLLVVEILDRATRHGSSSLAG